MISYTQLKKKYQSKIPDQTWWGAFDARVACLNQIIDELGENKKVILDIGSGWGINLAEIPARHFKIGMDLSKKRIEVSRSLNTSEKHFTSGDFYQLPFKNKSVDVIITMNIFEIDKSRLDVILQEITRVLKPDGTLYWTTPNGEAYFYDTKSKLRFDEIKSKLSKYFEMNEQKSWDPLSKCGDVRAVTEGVKSGTSPDLRKTKFIESIENKTEILLRGAQATKTVYDNAGRPSSRTFHYQAVSENDLGPIEATESWTYDDRSQLKTFTNKNGTVFTYNYDPQFRLSEILADGVAVRRYLQYNKFNIYLPQLQEKAHLNSIGF
jgi:YD repeat-containing protein